MQSLTQWNFVENYKRKLAYFRSFLPKVCLNPGSVIGDEALHEPK